MKYLSILSLLLLFACGSNTGETPAPPEELGLETVPEDQEVVEMREIEDYNPDNDERSLDDLIRIANVPAELVISSPFTVRGEARGTWFFENSFPVTLYDESGVVLSQSYGSSAENWMTDAFIPFDANIEFSAPSGTKATLELMLDNPGSPDEGIDRAIIIPVVIR